MQRQVSLGAEHHKFISLFASVLMYAAKALGVEVKYYFLFWVSGVSIIRLNLVRGAILFKAVTSEICIHAVQRPQARLSTVSWCFKASGNSH